jgi:flagellar biosynthesis protein
LTSEPDKPDDDAPLEAAALHYDRGSEGAPRVVAAGRGEIAKRIVELANEHGVPVRSEPELARALAQMKIDAEIPEELYAAVAETLVWAYRLDKSAA